MVGNHAPAEHLITGCSLPFSAFQKPSIDGVAQRQFLVQLGNRPKVMNSLNITGGRPGLIIVKRSWSRFFDHPTGAPRVAEPD